MRLYQVASAVKRHSALLQPLAIVFGFLLLLPVSVIRSESPTATTPTLADDLDRESLRIALQRSISHLSKLPPETVVGEQPRRFTAKQALDALRAFEPLLSRWDCHACWTKEFIARFELIPSSSDPALETVLFTGYYQPVIEASLVPTRSEERRVGKECRYRSCLYS